MTVSNVTDIGPIIHLSAKYINAFGYIERRKYLDGSLAVALITWTNSEFEPDHILVSVNLGSYGVSAAKDCFYVKTYSEHEGLADALVTTGLFKMTGTTTVGAYGTWFVEMQFV